MSEPIYRWWWCHAHRRNERQDVACPGAMGAPRFSPVEQLVRHDHLPLPAQDGPGRWWYNPLLDKWLSDEEKKLLTAKNFGVG